MAGGFARRLAAEDFEIASAGIAPSRVQPLAVDVMREVGVDISAHASKAIDPELLQRADVVVTLCGDANDRCPPVPNARRRLHWDLPDPPRARGRTEDRLAAFRAVRDDIRRRVVELLAAERARQEPL